MDMQAQVLNNRDVSTLPNLTEAEWNNFYGDFYAYLQEHVLQDRFTMFINTLADSKDGNGTEKFVYAGLQKQRELLEGDEYPNSNLKKSWEILKNLNMRTPNVKVSNELRKKIDGKKIGDINWTQGSMEDYFASNKLTNHRAENNILSPFFNIKDYHYFSFSLNCHDCFHTAIHIILNVKDLEKNKLANLETSGIIARGNLFCEATILLNQRIKNTAEIPNRLSIE